MRLQPTPWPPRLFFADAGLSALRAMMADGRQAHPKTFARVRRELGTDPAQDQDPAAEPLDAGSVAQGSGAAAFPPLAGWDNSPVSMEWNAPMARTPKADTLTPARRGRKPKAAASHPVVPSAEDDDTASAAAGAGVAATDAEGSTPARGRRGRKPMHQANATEPALPLAVGTDQAAAEASPPADGPEPAGDESDTLVAEMVVLASDEPMSDAGPEEHESAAPQAGDAVPTSSHSDTSAPAARWDQVTSTASFDWPAIERTAAQDGPNQAMAKLLLAARAEGAQSRWPL